MKIFQTTEKYLESGGIIRNKPPFNKKQSSIIVIAILSNILLFIYLFHEANLPREYMESILMTASAFFISIAYMSVVFRYSKIFKFIDDIEQVVNESKSAWQSHVQTMYKI